MKLLPKELASVQSRRKLAKRIYRNGEELAQNVEQLVGKLIKVNLLEKRVLKEVTSQLALNLNKYVSGFIKWVVYHSGVVF